MMLTTNVTELNESIYPNFIKEGLVLIDIYGEWCGPCKKLSPILDQLSVNLIDTIAVGKVDVDANRDIAMSLGVRNIPALILFKDGEIVARNSGLITLEDLTNLVNEHK